MKPYAVARSDLTWISARSLGTTPLGSASIAAAREPDRVAAFYKAKLSGWNRGWVGKGGVCHFPSNCDGSVGS